jgi:hypothetical protein
MSIAGDLTSICATATLAVTKFDVSGSVQYSANGSFSGIENISFGLQMTLPSVCFEAGRTCADLNDTYKQMMATDPTFSSVMCSMATAACVCLFESDQRIEQAGTWTSSGTTLSSTATNGQQSDDPYCVTGNELHLITLDTSTAGSSTIAGDAVYIRQ